MPQGRGLLCMSPNKAISFNLAAVRQMYPGGRPARFRAVAGMADSRKLYPEHGRAWPVFGSCWTAS